MSHSQELDLHRKLPEDLPPVDLYGIIHCDIVPRNILDRDLNLNIADSCGSSDRGSASRKPVGARDTIRIELCALWLFSMSAHVSCPLLSVLEMSMTKGLY